MLKLLYKMFCVALEDQTNEHDVPHASRRFITLLNALIKFCPAWAQMAPGRTVVYVFAQHLSLLLCLFALLCVFDFGNGEALLRFTSWEAAGSIWWGGEKKKTGPIPKSVAHEFEGSAAAGSRPWFLFRVRRLAPVHADGTSLPDFIWGNQIPPLLPSERRSISSHMSTRFVRLFITINCCST